MSEWTLHRQPKDQIADHEFSIWRDDDIVVMANIMPGEDGVLATIVDAVNSHDALVAALSDARTAIATLDEYDLGGAVVEHSDGAGAAYQYPLRDELLAKIDAAIATAVGALPRENKDG